MAQQHYDARQFLEQYHLVVEQDFTLDGQDASWGGEHDSPLVWGAERSTVLIYDFDPGRRSSPVKASTLTHDSRFLAVAIDGVVKVMDVVTWLVCDEFRNEGGDIRKLRFLPGTKVSASSESYYNLVLEDFEAVRAFRLSTDGRFIVEMRGHEGPGPIQQAPLTYPSARLSAAAYRPHSEFASHDGQYLALALHGETTQQYTRAEDLLPQLAIVTTDSFVELERLKGLSDYIT